MFSPGLFSSSPITPSLGNRTSVPLKNLSSVTTAEVSHLSATGNILVAGVARKNLTGLTTVAAQWGPVGAQVTVPELVWLTVSGVGHLLVWVDVLRGGFVGTGNCNLTFSGSVRDMVFFVQDIVDLPSGFIGNTVANVEITSLTTIAATITRANAASLLVSISGFDSGNADPLSPSAGWTSSATARTGTTNIDVAGLLATKVAGAVGDETLTVTGLAADLERAVAIVELLPI